MSDQTYLTVAYLGMIGALALWTWTVFARSKTVVTIDVNTPESVENDS